MKDTVVVREIETGCLAAVYLDGVLAVGARAANVSISMELFDALEVSLMDATLFEVSEDRICELGEYPDALVDLFQSSDATAVS